MSEIKKHLLKTNPTAEAALTHNGWRGGQRGLVAACALVLLLISILSPAALSAQNNNVLVSEGFEGEFKSDPYCRTGSCNVPAGWGVWFIPRRETDQPGINFQPQYVQVNAGNRVKGGSAAQRIYTENATHTGGIYRIVSDVKVGAKLRFSAWGQSWSTNDESPISARPSPDIKLKIGIDPMGGNNGQASPLNGQVVWSEERDAKDTFTEFSVEVEARAPTVIIYMYSTMKDPVRHNEVFWDDAVLEYTAPPPEPTAAPTTEAGSVVTDTQATPATVETAVPTSAPTVQASAGITHTVVEGDTLYDIALKYNKSVEEIKRLNNLSNDLLNIGQVLVIEPPTDVGVGGGEAAVQATEVPEATPTPGAGALCVQAYFDNNGDGERNQADGEDLVPNVVFNLTANNQPVTSYTSNGVDEPYCIRDLSASAYTVAAVIAPAYNATTPLNDTVNVPGGAAAQFSVGLRRVTDGSEVVSGATDVPVVQVAASSGPNILAIVATIGGGLIILGAIAIGVLFFLQSRRV